MFSCKDEQPPKTLWRPAPEARVDVLALRRGAASAGWAVRGIVGSPGVAEVISRRTATALRYARCESPSPPADWASYGFPVTSTIYNLVERSRVLWGGTAGGITGVHEWMFRETPGGVRVETNESFA